ncbi:threonine-phosphate decarboxylase CobD [Secundilactobacillus collinoides]|uniref:threonine-phosphate decarboxylase n=1 Tax=Secundilactobacillus collinoides TaxID=33960 RepID=A0A161XS18_SECCO|nr:threonine-phosphate decarboxylase CobD [Secundilactobacillus collinoides]KZL37060.1 hypothetical protein TY91_13500 [Secundilactobacillus collinoides]
MKVTHGGNRELIAQKIGVSEDQLVDFSANINPLGLSPRLKQVITDAVAEVIYYPNPQYPELRAAIGSHFNLPSSDVFVGNGAVQMIFDTATALQSKHALVLAPTFGEYERSLTRAGAAVSHFEMKPENDFRVPVHDLLAHLEAHSDIDLVCLCNPNNPSGQVVKPVDVQQLADYCLGHDVWLILDEAFMDLIDHDSLSYAGLMKPTDPVIILRSATKFFAIPGLRLGFALTRNERLKQCLVDAQEPWSVNTMAARFGEHMYEDTDYIDRTYDWLTAEKPYLYQALKTITYLTVYPSVTNYYLLKSTIPKLREKLWQQGIMIRDCSDYVALSPDYYRVAVRGHNENMQLIAALQSLA